MMSLLTLYRRIGNMKEKHLPVVVFDVDGQEQKCKHIASIEYVHEVGCTVIRTQAQSNSKPNAPK